MRFDRARFVPQLLYAPNQLTLLRMVFLPFIVINLIDEKYGWALGLFVLAGLSDGLDGLLARTLHQQTRLGQYLDPVADKLLMSTMFLVLSVLHQVPWKFTVVVFSRDVLPVRLLEGRSDAIHRLAGGSIYETMERDLGLVIHHGVASFTPARASKLAASTGTKSP